MLAELFSLWPGVLLGVFPQCTLLLCNHYKFGGMFPGREKKLPWCKHYADCGRFWGLVVSAERTVLIKRHLGLLVSFLLLRYVRLGSGQLDCDGFAPRVFWGTAVGEHCYLQELVNLRICLKDKTWRSAKNDFILINYTVLILCGKSNYPRHSSRWSESHGESHSDKEDERFPSKGLNWFYPQGLQH